MVYIQRLSHLYTPYEIGTPLKLNPELFCFRLSSWFLYYKFSHWCWNNLDEWHHHSRRWTLTSHENFGLKTSCQFLSHHVWLQCRMFLIRGRWEDAEHFSILSGKGGPHGLSAQGWATRHQPVCLISVIRKLTFPHTWSDPSCPFPGTSCPHSEYLNVSTIWNLNYNIKAFLMSRL